VAASRRSPSRRSTVSSSSGSSIPTSSTWTRSTARCAAWPSAPVRIDEREAPMAETTMPYGRPEFREAIRHPQAHAFVLGQYRLGEHAGVVALGRLLAEMEPEARLRRAMEIHHRDEGRHSQLFTDWMSRLGVTPAPLPDDVEGFF